MKATVPQDQQVRPLWKEVDAAFGSLGDEVDAASNVLEAFGEVRGDPNAQAAIIGPKLRETYKEVYERVLALCSGHDTQEQTPEPLLDDVRDSLRRMIKAGRDLPDDVLDARIASVTQKFLAELEEPVQPAAELMSKTAAEPDTFSHHNQQPPVLGCDNIVDTLACFGDRFAGLVAWAYAMCPRDSSCEVADLAARAVVELHRDWEKVWARVMELSALDSEARKMN